MNNKWMNWIYDININDERERQEFTTILQDNHLIITILLLAASLISLVQDSFHHTLTFGTIALFLIMLASSVHLTQNIRILGLNRYYVYSEEEYKLTKRNVLRRHLFTSLFIALCWLSGTYSANLHLNAPIHFTIDNITGLIAFTGTYYFIGRHTKNKNIIKEYEE